MNKLIAVCSIALLLFSCKSKKIIPDVSAIKVPFTTLRFEQDFFAIDTNNISASLNTLHNKYGAFLNDFLYNILSLPPQPNSVITLPMS